MRLEQYAVLCIKNKISRCELWDTFQEIGKKHGLSLVTDLIVDIDDDETVYFDKSTSLEYRLSVVREKFLKFKRELFIGMIDWEEGYSPDIWFKRYYSPWSYEIRMDWENISFYDGKETLCQNIEALFKDLFVRLPCDFGFGCHEYIYKRQLKLLTIHKSLLLIPTLSDKVFEMIETCVEAYIGSVVFPVSPQKAEEARNYAFAHTWTTERPVWFYLLSKERYEVSKPYLLDLPVEAIEKFPALKGYGVKRVEELPNGGAFIFLDYPYDFDP